MKLCQKGTTTVILSYFQVVIYCQQCAIGHWHKRAVMSNHFKVQLDAFEQHVCPVRHNVKTTGLPTDALRTSCQPEDALLLLLIVHKIASLLQVEMLSLMRCTMTHTYFVPGTFVLLTTATRIAQPIICWAGRGWVA